MKKIKNFYLIKNKSKIHFFRCNKCLVTSTRPRVTFKNGICTACLNFEERKKIDWNKRYKILKKLCDKFRGRKGEYDVVVPVGGGKDSSYVAWRLKHSLKMNPLCVFCEPPLMTKIGEDNLKNFEKSGFDVLKIPHIESFKNLNKYYFAKYGLPQHVWLSAIKIAPLKIASIFNIKLIMWGEEGESMYGGLNKKRNNMLFNIKDIPAYCQNKTPLIIPKNLKSKESEFTNLVLKKNEFSKLKNLKMLHWSFFEKWDENKHMILAKKFCGLKDASVKEKNAINKHSHTDQKMFALHMYLAYLKYGFSRATSDTSIEIRHGRLTKNQAIKITKKYDHLFPKEYLKDYCRYFNISKKNFFSILLKHTNKNLFE